MSAHSSSPPVTPPSSDSEDETFDDRSALKNKYPSNRHPSPHPLAASTKADREPPSYQKRYSLTPTSSIKTIFPASCLPKSTPEPSTPPTPIQFQSPQTELSRWDAAITNVIDKAESKIDLSFLNLTFIPPSISDLKNLVVLPKRELFPSVEPSGRKFQKSLTAPASGGLFNRPSTTTTTTTTLLPPADIAVAPTRPFARTGTSINPPGSVSRFIPSTKHLFMQNGLELYLMSNRITSLPRELFELERLVVLSLRGNKLTFLPPAIRFLKSLRELNIANNRIHYLPAEIQELRLNTLHLHPNPYLEPPDTSINLGGKRLLGPLKLGSIIPSLRELALRCLLTSDGTQSTRIEGALSLAEIDALPVPDHIRSILRASTGHSRGLSQTKDDAVLDMRSNHCPSPRHRKISGLLTTVKNVRFQTESKDFVFNVPSEERMEWVGKVAGVTVGNTLKAFIPILWRGCGYGCLDFLETEDFLQNPGSTFTKAFGSAIDENGDEFEFSDGE